MTAHRAGGRPGQRGPLDHAALRRERATRREQASGGPIERTRNDAGRLVITAVPRGTPAIDAGLNVDDEIIAVDEVRVRPDGLPLRLAQYRVGDRVSVTVARRDRLMKFEVTLAAEAGRAWRLEQSPTATEEQRLRFDRLMSGH